MHRAESEKDTASSADASSVEKAGEDIGVDVTTEEEAYQLLKQQTKTATFENQLKTSYILTGPPFGPLIVFLHGISLPALVSFHRLVKTLVTSGFRCLLFDFFGRGLSDSPNDIYNDQLFVSQTISLLNVLGLEETPFTLIGLSMGGAVAARLSQQYPHKVKSLILVAPAGLPINVPLIARVARMAVIGDFLTWALGNMRLRRGIHSIFLHPEKHAEDIQRMEEAFDSQVEHQNGQFIWCFLSTLRNFPLSSLSDTYRDIGKNPRPVLLLWGKKDSVVEFHLCSELKKLLNKETTQVVEVDDCGHGILHESPHVVSNAILSFLKENNPTTEP